jgi:hypothetical protein
MKEHTRPTLPKAAEWNTSALPPDRATQLDSGLSFEEIAAAIANNSTILASHAEPSRDTHAGARQVIFKIALPQPTYDAFYNAPDGLRGRYWQSPDHGFQATRQLIALLKPKLLAYAEENPPKLVRKDKRAHEMTLGNVATSLEAVSAKVWVYEKDSTGNLAMPFEGQPQLIVPRWIQNEKDPAGKGQRWRWTPFDGEIEIKGGLIDSHGIERIPEGKRDRSCQIHRFGFT